MVATKTGVRRPLHDLLRQQLKREIAEGRWRPGDRIPSEQAIARTYGVSLITSRRALRDLAQEGVVTRRAPAGTFVAQPATRRHTIAVAALGTKSIDTPFFGPMLAGMHQSARDRADLRVATPSDGVATPTWLKQVASAGDMEGVLIVTADPVRYEDIAYLELVGFPYVLVNRRVPGRAVWAVALDDYGIGRQAVDYLHSLGHRSIAHLAGPRGWNTADDRLRGFLEGLATHGLLGDGDTPNLVAEGHGALEAAPVAFGAFTYGVANDYRIGADGMRALLERHPRPTAVFAAADHLAVGAYHAIQDAGLRVGEDVSVIAVAGMALAEALRPTLTAFEHQRVEMGVEAVALLIDQIERRVTPEDAVAPDSRVRIVRAAFVERESCRRANGVAVPPPVSTVSV